MRKAVLQRLRFSGGLALPNFLYYYWSAHVHKLTYWLQSRELLWCRLESQSCRLTSLKALVCAPLPINPSQFTKNPVVQSTLKIWSQYRNKFKLSSASITLPIIQNHLFKPGLSDATYTKWEKLGIETFQDLFREGTFLSFSDLSSKYKLPTAHLFRYFQIRHCVSSLFSCYPSLPDTQPWEQLLALKPNKKSVISIIYKQLMDMDIYSTVKIKTSWEQELGITISDQLWEKAISTVRTSTPSARLQLIQFKVLYRVHYSKTRLAKIYPQVADQCERCLAGPCDLSHMFYLCPRLHNFWNQYSDTLSKALKIRVDLNPYLAIFGLPVKTVLNDSTQSKILAFTSLIARRRILLNWKSPKAPSISQWFHDVLSFLKLEKINLSIKGNGENFEQKWGPFLEYGRSLQTLPSN